LPSVFLFSHSSPAPRALPAFLTRRSSDLAALDAVGTLLVSWRVGTVIGTFIAVIASAFVAAAALTLVAQNLFDGRARDDRDEGRSAEHTSELQSLTNLVCRLLLEIKKTSS